MLHRVLEANRFRRAALAIRPTIYDRSTSPTQLELRLPIGSDCRDGTKPNPPLPLSLENSGAANPLCYSLSFATRRRYWP